MQGVAISLTFSQIHVMTDAFTIIHCLVVSVVVWFSTDELWGDLNTDEQRQNNITCTVQNSFYACYNVSTTCTGAKADIRFQTISFEGISQICKHNNCPQKSSVSNTVLDMYPFLSRMTPLPFLI